MIELHPVTREGHGVRLESLTHGHHDGLASATGERKPTNPSIVHAKEIHSAGCPPSLWSP